MSKIGSVEIHHREAVDWLNKRGQDVTCEQNLDEKYSLQLFTEHLLRPLWIKISTSI